MTPEELRAECHAVLASEHRTMVLLTVPREKEPAGFKARLFGTNGPLGEVMNWGDGKMTGYWPATRILAYLDKHL